jgi:hypothetical protein
MVSSQPELRLSHETLAACGLAHSVLSADAGAIDGGFEDAAGVDGRADEGTAGTEGDRAVVEAEQPTAATASTVASQTDRRQLPTTATTSPATDATV